MFKLASATALILSLCSLPSYAWWDSNWADDFFGNGFGTGDFDFGFSMRGRGQGYGRGYGYDAPYWGYAPYYRPPYHGAPGPAQTPPLTDEQRATLAEQQKTIAEQQRKAFEQAVAAQREFAERLNREMLAPPALPTDISKRIQEHEAHRDALIRERESRFNSPLQAPRTIEMKRQREEVQLRRTEMQNKQQDQHNPVMTQPDKEM